ncbi:MAG: hypothetical protein EH225_08230, partial [Calditrichaeota bacterium]
PMWPAGIGGQYAHWSDNLKAYVISEPTRKNTGLVGSPLGEGISSTPAHMLADAPAEFKIDVAEPEKFRNVYIPVYMAGSKGNRDSLFAFYRKLQENPQQLYQQNVDYYRQLRENSLQIHTPDSLFNLAFEWSKIAYDNLFIENPDLGEGLVAGLHASGTSGRPGFGWYFGGDAFMNMLSLNSLGFYESVKDALVFTQKWQREDGKMAHELSQAAGYLDWWKDYPYGYIHADTTPFYIVAMSDYFQRTGDLVFIEKSWNSLVKAYQWCVSTDKNGDGLMDNRSAGLGASEYGDLTNIETDVYLAAVWIKATEEMQRLAEALDEGKWIKRASRDFKKALKSFQEKFWYSEGGFYAYAFNAKGEHVKEISPWLSVGLMWNYGNDERTVRSLKRLNSADMTTDWGVRLLSRKSSFFNAVGYNYGAIWPFVTGWVTMAQFVHAFPLQGYMLLRNNLMHTFHDQLGTMPEVLSGMFHTPLEESVAHQGFSTGGVVLPMVRGLTGLQGNSVENTVDFSPAFPFNWEQVNVKNMMIGSSRFDFSYQNTGQRINCLVTSHNAAGYRLTFSPVLPPGTQVTSVQLNDLEIPFDLHKAGDASILSVIFPVSESQMIITAELQPVVSILPPDFASEIGDMNRGLKIISVEKQDSSLVAELEGLSGQDYLLPVTHSELIKDTRGAVPESGNLLVNIP